jgi:hypothetical protein
MRENDLHHNAAARPVAAGTMDGREQSRADSNDKEAYAWKRQACVDARVDARSDTVPLLTLE